MSLVIAPPNSSSPKIMKENFKGLIEYMYVDAINMFFSFSFQVSQEKIYHPTV